MDGPPASELTQTLCAVAAGEQGADERLLSVVYDELRQLARALMAAERPGHTLQTTALVHEAYLRLVGSGDLAAGSRRHFFAAAAEAMRRILIEHARARLRLKRGGGGRRLILREGDVAIERRPEDILALDEALLDLEAHDGRLAEIVKLRFFAGLTIENTAETLGVTSRTVNRDWSTARAWLRIRLGRSGGHEN